ncbi:MAG: hypothetical protein SOX84_07840 [Prevotella sp.]|nr:hypothetical protein [Prevotella sp.]MDY4218673.1 hypothetical protein [Prevotella sp.]
MNCCNFTNETSTIRKRVGTDLFLTYVLKENGQEVNLSEREDIKVFIFKAGVFDSKERQENFSVSGSSLQLQINAKENTRKGVFGIRIEYRVQNALSETGYMVVIHDIPTAFEIVGSSSQETLPENLNAESDVIRFGVDGLNAFETWKKYTDRVDATFEDYMAAIKGERGEKGEQGAAGAGGSSGELETAFQEWKSGKIKPGTTPKESYDSKYYIRELAGEKMIDVWRANRYENPKNEDLLDFAAWMLAQNAPEVAHIRFKDKTIEAWALKNFDKEGKGYITVADAGNVEQADFMAALEKLRGQDLKFLEFEYFTKVQEISEYDTPIYPGSQTFKWVAFPKSLKKVHLRTSSNANNRWGVAIGVPTEVLILQAPVTFYSYPILDVKEGGNRPVYNPVTGKTESVYVYNGQVEPYISINGFYRTNDNTPGDF